MSEFKSKWLNFPETHQTPSAKSDKRASGTSVTPLLRRSGEKNDSSVVNGAAVGIVEGREYEIDETSPHGLNRQPPPIGYGGFDLDEVAWAERWNDKMGVVDPIYRKLNCWMWLASYYIYLGDIEKARACRKEYHVLRHEDETITESCGLCEAHRISPLKSFEP